MSPLIYAAALGEYTLVEFLIEHYKASVHSKDKFKRSALIMAIKNGHLDVAKLLLKHGSDFNDKDINENTPLHYAASAGRIDCIELLISLKVDIIAKNN